MNSGDDDINVVNESMENLEKYGDTQYPEPTNNTHAKFYKQNPVLPNNQESRRRILLETQKKRRESNFDKTRPNVQQSSSRNRYNKKFMYKLMFSEWFAEIPELLESEWCFKVCPEGTRALVVAQKGSTIHYNKNGKFVYKFPSLLPGGNYQDRAHPITMLDCVYNKSCKTYYILDVLSWRGKDLTDCETEFRFFWLQSKFSDEPQMSEHTTLNEYAFIPIQSEKATRENIAHTFSTEFQFTNSTLAQPKIDGILFFHQETTYEPGFTPLVGWLKCYMLPEILSIPVHESYNLAKPSNYTNLENLIQESRESKYNWWTNVKKDKKKGTTEVEMEHLMEVNKIETESESSGVRELGDPFVNPDLYNQKFNFSKLFS